MRRTRILCFLLLTVSLGSLGQKLAISAVQAQPDRLIVDNRTDVVVGVHMVGPEAGEIIQGLAIALKCGATKAQFDATIGIHPTAAEEMVTMRTAQPEPAQAAAG